MAAARRAGTTIPGNSLPPHGGRLIAVFLLLHDLARVFNAPHAYSCGALFNGVRSLPVRRNNCNVDGADTRRHTSRVPQPNSSYSPPLNNPFPNNAATVDTTLQTRETASALEGASSASSGDDTVAPVLESGAADANGIDDFSPVAAPGGTASIAVSPAPVATMKTRPVENAPTSRALKLRGAFAGCLILACASALALHFEVEPPHKAPPQDNRKYAPSFRAPQSGQVPFIPGLTPQLQGDAPANPRNPSGVGANGVGTQGATSENPSKQSREAPAFERGVAAQKAGKALEAIAAYQQALKLNPNLVPAHLNLALLYLVTKKPEQAEPHLRAAWRLNPRNPAAPFQLAQTLWSLRRPREALKPLQAAVRLSPRNPQGHAALAQLFAALNQPQAALESWKRVASLVPNDAQSNFAAGTLALQLGQLPDAERYLRRATQLETRDARGPLFLARALAARGKTREAQSVLEAGVKRFPRVVELQTLLADVREAGGDRSGAASALQDAVQGVPDGSQGGVPAGRLNLALGRSLAQSKRWSEAAKALRRAAALLPQDADAPAMLGEVLARSGDKKGAITQWRRALQLDPRRTALHLASARVLAASGRWSEAGHEYSSYVQAQPRDIAALAEYAGVQERQGRLAQAAASWSRVAKTLPNNPLPSLQSARLLRRVGQDKEALAALNNALRIAPKNPDALLEAARLEEKSGAAARAMNRWRALIQVRPDYNPAYDALLQLAAREKQMPSAIAFLYKRLNANPERPTAYAALVNFYEKTENPEAGRKIIAAVAARNPRAVAPQKALLQFDLNRARRRLKELRAADQKRGTASVAPTPTEAPGEPDVKSPSEPTSPPKDAPDESKTTP